MTLVPNVLLFGRLLRRLGLDVSLSELGVALDALTRVGVGQRRDVYHALRSTLVRGASDLGRFDAAFTAFWQDHGERWGRRDLHAVGEPRTSVSVQIDTVLPEEEAFPIVDEHQEGSRPPVAELRTASSVSALGQRDFAEMSADELAEATAALDELTWEPGRHTTRRWVAGSDARLDIRRTLRANAGGGELLRLRYLQRTTRPRPLVLIADVSGSMERYSRMLLHWGHVLTRSARRVESFVFATELTRITDQLRARRVDDALAAAGRQVRDWAGGTRIGGALRVFHQEWARRVLSSRAVVLLVSDGWDRGDPQELARETARLQRSCSRLIWLTPLLGTRDYQPLTRGLVTALPHVDDFLPVRTLKNLRDLALHLNTLGDRRGPRRQHVPG